MTIQSVCFDSERVLRFYAVVIFLTEKVFKIMDLVFDLVKNQGVWSCASAANYNTFYNDFFILMF